MGKALATAFPESAAVFEEADSTLGFSLSRLCFEGPEADLQLTANTQPALLATSLAAYRAFVKRGPKPNYVAGHSLGEYSALVAAGSLGLADGLRTVRRRGQYMQEAVPVGEGAMAAILGLDRGAVEAVCKEAAGGDVVSPANINSPGQIVIAGHARAVDRAIPLLKAAGAKRAIRLNVSAPFHCALMMPAQLRLAEDLRSIPFRDPEVPLVNNIAAKAVRSAAECREGLVGQVSSPVLFQESVENLFAQGVRTFVEVGGGSVLQGLVKKTVKDAQVLGVHDPESLEKTLAALEGRPN